MLARREDIVMLRIAFLTACAALLLSSTAGADVFKYVDEKGNVQYTDRPTKLPAERVNVQTQRTDVVELNERADDDAKAMADRDKARQQAAAQKADQRKAAETNAESKAELCNKARQDYLNRMNAQRLYEEQPNGERRYLSSEELDASRAAAKQAMDTLCK